MSPRTRERFRRDFLTDVDSSDVCCLENRDRDGEWLGVSGSLALGIHNTPPPVRKGSEIATRATAALAALRNENHEGSTAVYKADLLANVQSILYVLKIRTSIRVLDVEVIVSIINICLFTKT